VCRGSGLKYRGYKAQFEYTTHNRPPLPSGGSVCGAEERGRRLTHGAMTALLAPRPSARGRRLGPISNYNPPPANPRQSWPRSLDRSRDNQRTESKFRPKRPPAEGHQEVAAQETLARTRANTGAPGEKKPTENGWFWESWWWGGDRSATSSSEPASTLRAAADSCNIWRRPYPYLSASTRLSRYIYPTT
jgi:hypothetical protein